MLRPWSPTFVGDGTVDVSLARMIETSVPVERERIRVCEHHEFLRLAIFIISSIGPWSFDQAPPSMRGAIVGINAKTNAVRGGGRGNLHPHTAAKSACALFLQAVCTYAADHKEESDWILSENFRHDAHKGRPVCPEEHTGQLVMQRTLVCACAPRCSQLLRNGRG